MSAIPTYALYGGTGRSFDVDWLHLESIQARSRLHNYRIRPHRHEHLFQILHMTAGMAEVVVDGRMILLRPPMIVTVPAFVVHGYGFSPDVQGTVVTLFERELADMLAASPEIFAFFAAPRLMPLGRCAAAEVAAEHVKAIAHEFFGQAAGRQDAIQARLALLLIALHRHGIAAIAPPVRRDRASDIVDRFRRLVDEEFRSRRPIAAYAERLGLTHTHLSRLCRQVLNDTALGVLNRRIVLEATRLLTFTALDVKEVAAALGFDDPAYFARFFRRETGRTPSEFRAGRSAADQ